ncbi:indoleacetamide hydrolase [Cognatishimia sp. WU-CL00825]|uniref:amidase family protein n=1 Tax=Cognatishimia sp. WU-CL00825 TaxID=3127658 RepID=UPI0031037467
MPTSDDRPAPNFRPMTLAQARQIRDTQGAQALQDLSLMRLKTDKNHVVIAHSDSPAPTLDGPLAGIPFGIKDNIDCLPFATTGGSPALRDNKPTKDASVVALLKTAGANPIGKLNLHELAFGVTNNNGFFGAVSTPFDARRVAGGSSGGSAAAVAQGLVPFALGSDTGGSTRIPAAFCGIAGFRPTTGRYPAAGVLSLSPTRDTIGPMAYCVADLLEIDAIIAPHDGATPAIHRPLRVGLIYQNAGLSAALDQHFTQAINGLEMAGLIECVPITTSEFDELEPRMGQAIVGHEAHAFWTRFCDETLGISYAEFAQALGTPTVQQIFTALPSRLAASSAAYPAEIHAQLARLRQTYAAVFADNRLDLIAMPTVSVPPPHIGDEEMMPTDRGDQPTFPTIVKNTSLASLVGSPSLSLPAGTDAHGLPVGIMIEALPGSDRFVLAAGALLESQLQSQ